MSQESPVKRSGPVRSILTDLRAKRQLSRTPDHRLPEDGPPINKPAVEGEKGLYAVSGMIDGKKKKSKTGKRIIVASAILAGVVLSPVSAAVGAIASPIMIIAMASKDVFSTKNQRAALAECNDTSYDINDLVEPGSMQEKVLAEMKVQSRRQLEEDKVMGFSRPVAVIGSILTAPIHAVTGAMCVPFVVPYVLAVIGLNLKELTAAHMAEEKARHKEESQGKSGAQ